VHSWHIQHLKCGSALHSTAHFAPTQVETELCHPADSCDVVLVVLSYILVSLGLGLLCVAGYTPSRHVYLRKSFAVSVFRRAWYTRV
jgi:hypothetical protein